MDKFSKNPTHPKLLFLTEKQIKELKTNGYNVPFQDFDLGKVGFDKVKKSWTLEKRTAFAASCLREVGLSFVEGQDGGILIEIDYENKLLPNVINNLTEKRTRVRVPEKEISSQI